MTIANYWALSDLIFAITIGILCAMGVLWFVVRIWQDFNDWRVRRDIRRQARAWERKHGR